MPARGKRAQLLAWLDAVHPLQIDENTYAEIASALAPISPGYLRKLIRESGVPLHPMVEGVRQTNLDELEHTLRALLSEYLRADHARQLAVRRLVIEAKDHARLASRTKVLHKINAPISREQISRAEGQIETARTDETRTDETRTGETRTGETRADKTHTDKTHTKMTRTDETHTDKTRMDQTHTETTREDATDEGTQPRTEEARIDQTHTDMKSTDTTRASETRTNKTNPAETHIETTRESATHADSQTRADEPHSDHKRTDLIHLDQTRAAKQEVILWLTTWLENPPLFPEWARLRRIALTAEGSEVAHESGTGFSL